MQERKAGFTAHGSGPTLHDDGLHTILDVHGSGHYVGNFLQVFTRYAGWWGEGDTIFDLDGKTMTHTPGTEDEYGSCWEFGHTFSYMYAGYIQNEAGKNRMYRWYVTNPVRFQKSLKVVIQNQRNEGRHRSQARTITPAWPTGTRTEPIPPRPCNRSPSGRRRLRLFLTQNEDALLRRRVGVESLAGMLSESDGGCNRARRPDGNSSGPPNPGIDGQFVSMPS